VSAFSDVEYSRDVHGG